MSQSTLWEGWLALNPEFSFVGSDEVEEDSSDSAEDSEDDSEDDGPSGDVDGEDDSSSDDDDDDDTNARLKRLEKKNSKLSKQLEAALELLNKNNDGEAGKAPEGFVAQQDYDDAVEALSEMAIHNAISNGPKNKDGSPKYDWEDPAVVMKFIDMDEVEFDLKSKSVEGIDDQLAEVAERYPFMLKDKGKRTPAPGKSGTRPRKQGTREVVQTPSEASLLVDFPAMKE